LESSFFAFRNTLSRFIESYERVIKEYNNGYVYISKEHINKVFQFLDEDNPEGIERLIEQKRAERLDAKQFSPDFLDELKSDLKILKNVQAMWEGIRRDPKWNSFGDLLKGNRQFRKNKLIIFTESKETAEYLAERVAEEIDSKVILFTGSSTAADREKILANFDPRAFQPKDDYRILVTTEVLSEGVNLHRANMVVNYDIPWNPTRLIQRVGRVNRVDTEFDTIHTYNFFPTDESEDVIKLKAAAEAKIEAFIEMLGSDARLLTEGEEIKSHDLFMRLNSRKTITGEDESEESELQYLAEIRSIRDSRPDLFERIKRLPKKARSTRKLEVLAALQEYPALLTYFRQGKLDKFFLAQASTQPSAELDFFAAVKLLKPEDEEEKRLSITREFYPLLEGNKQAFLEATTIEGGDGVPHRNSPNDAYILKRLKAKDIRKFQGFTDEDELYVRQVIGLLDDGALPRPTTKKVATSLKKEAAPLRVLGILKRDIPREFFQATPADASRNAYSPREVILSSFISEPADSSKQ
ncbi:MAG TPA: helicase, partial [Blastocatellia bacterium]|nr:helicase [Blastocatellia bacterium]